MELGLRGKRAWVLGASSGLGLGIATQFAAEGAHVVLSSRSVEKLDDSARLIGGYAVPLDVGEGRGAIEAACSKTVDTLSGLDIVVVNHGGPPPGGFDSIDDVTFSEAYELVLASAFRITKAVVPHLRRAGGGVILYITSSTTKEVVTDLFLSNTMRAGVVGMMKTFSRELGGEGIRLLCVAPGRIATDRTESVDQAVASRTGRTAEQVRHASEMGIPLGRYGLPAELASVAVFLCSAQASFVTGCSVVVDGGMLSGLLT